MTTAAPQVQAPDPPAKLPDPELVVPGQISSAGVYYVRARTAKPPAWKPRTKRRAKRRRSRS